MNRYIEELTLNLQKDIKETSLYQQYVFYKGNIANNLELNQLKNQLKYLKGCKLDEETKKKYYELENKYNSHPLVVNYNNYKQELIDLLNEIRNILV